MKYAEVAAENGNVRGVGRGKKKGEKYDYSTEQYPKIIPLVLDTLVSTAGAILRLAKAATVGRKRNSDSPN